MLVPGEYLLKPQPEAPPAKSPAERPAEPTRTAVETVPAVPTVPAQERESRSFLQILLRALGAVHT